MAVDDRLGDVDHLLAVVLRVVRRRVFLGGLALTIFNTVTVE
jgi:hypothetical protein